MTIKAPEGKIVLVLDEPERTLVNGLFLPDQSVKPSTVGTVVASKHPDVKQWDRVMLFHSYAGASFTLDGNTYTTVVPGEIVGVLDD